MSKRIERRPLYYSLHDWAEGALQVFCPGQEDIIARLQAEALIRLVAAGEIGDKDRERVIWLTRYLYD
jgi:hypothetical protein